MKNTIRQLFHSPNFVVGFVIFVGMLLAIFLYPIFHPGSPLEMIGVGTFAKPGLYISVYDSVNSETETLRLPDADEKRSGAVLSDEDRVAMIEWFGKAGVDTTNLDASDDAAVLELWKANYDPDKTIKGLTKAKRAYYRRLNEALANNGEAELYVATKDADSGELVEKSEIDKDAYVNTKDVANVKRLVLGTDNFGRDMLKELLAAAKTSLMIGLIAGSIATMIGLILGLISGYVGGIVDDIILFVMNIFTVIPSFVILILISYSLGQSQRGAGVVAMIIGFTSWVWAARSARSQVISLRNRDHVNLSKLSGHSLLRIIFTDILPYILSYVVMAFILQISSGILAEAQLSMLGLGPKTTEVPTLGLMMSWAQLYSAHMNGSWWAYFPVIFTIALISFSLNLMNTGMDQVFNPALRD